MGVSLSTLLPLPRTAQPQTTHDVAADRFDVIGVRAKFVPDVGYLSEVRTWPGVAVIAAALDAGPVRGRDRTSGS